MHRSYISNEWLLANKDITNNKALLPIDVATRFLNIVRIKPKEKVAVFDGCGHELIGFIEKVDKNNAYLTDFKFYIYEPKSYQIILMQSSLAFDKISETIKRCTEFGVDKFTIFNAQHSDAFSYEKLIKKTDRLKAISIDSARQSGRVFIPRINFFPNIKELLKNKAENSIGFFGIINAKENFLLKAKELINKDIKNIYIAIGPEGGFSKKEEEILSDANFHKVSFGPNILRSEFAALFPVSILVGLFN